MTDTNKKNQTSFVNKAVIGAAGVAAGVLATKAFKVLSDEKVQKDIKDTLEDAKEKVAEVKEKVEGTMEELQKTAPGKKTKASK